MLKEYSHLKERSPIDTIKIIQQFFNDQQLQVKIVKEQSEIDSFYCELKLYKNDLFILSSSGKGVTNEYSLASGYAELYERYCNKTFLLNSLIVNKKIEEINNKKYIKNFNYKKLINDYDFIQQFFYIFNNEELSKYLKIITNNIFIPEEFISITNNQNKIILDNRIMMKITGSNGMCAGNSFEEAFNQGMSEIYERWCHKQFILNIPNQLYQLSNKVLIKLNIYPYIQKLEKLGYKIYIFDLGYNYEAPVILTIIINPKKMNMYYNLGSFPILNIAIERTFTEIYQGVQTYNDSKIMQQQIPFKSITPKQLLSRNATSTLNVFCIDENIFNKIQLVDQCSNLFINENSNNFDIFNYFQILNKKHKFNIYYQNNSLQKDMFSLYLFCPETTLYNINEYKNDQQSTINIEYIFGCLQAHLDFIDNCLINNINQCLVSLLYLEKYNKDIYNYIINSLLYQNDFNFFSSSNSEQIQLNLIQLLLNYKQLYKLNNKIFTNDSLSIYQTQLVKFIFIQNYFKSGYSATEIEYYLHLFFNSNMCDKKELLNNINNPEYIFKNIFLIPFQTQFNSEEFKQIILQFY